MRRILATAVLGVALLSVAACADVPQDEPSASPSAPAAATTTAAASNLADKKSTCSDYLALDADSTSKGQSIALRLQSAGSDQIAAALAVSDLIKLFDENDTKLNAIAAKAGDAQLKAAIEADIKAKRDAKSALLAAGTDQTQLMLAYSTADTSKSDKVKSLCS